MRTLIRHIRSNAVAYLALFFALGGGGGYAIAATTGTSRTIHTCVVKKTGELLAKRRCTSAEKPVSLNSGTVTVAKAATPGLGAVSAYANIAPNGAVDEAKNMTVTAQGPGQFKLSVSSSVCPANGKAALNVAPVGSILAPTGTPAEVPVASSGSADDPQSMEIQVGTLQNGTFSGGGTSEDPVGASVQVDC